MGLGQVCWGLACCSSLRFSPVPAGATPPLLPPCCSQCRQPGRVAAGHHDLPPGPGELPAGGERGGRVAGGRNVGGAGKRIALSTGWNVQGLRVPLQAGSWHAGGARPSLAHQLESRNTRGISLAGCGFSAGAHHCHPHRHVQVITHDEQFAHLIGETTPGQQRARASLRAGPGCLQHLNLLKLSVDISCRPRPLSEESLTPPPHPLVQGRASTARPCGGSPRTPTSTRSSARRKLGNECALARMRKERGRVGWGWGAGLAPLNLLAMAGSLLLACRGTSHCIGACYSLVYNHARCLYTRLPFKVKQLALGTRGIVKTPSRVSVNRPGACCKGRYT